jgi:cell division protein FtsW
MKLRYDLILFATVLTLLFLGLIMTFSSSSVATAITLNDPYYYLKRQSFFALLCLFACAFGASVPLEKVRQFAYPFYGMTLLLLVLVLIPGIGHKAGGATRWIAIGPFHLQPGEIAKLAIVVYLAMSLAKKGEKMLLFRVGIVPHLVLPGLVMGLLLLEPDFGCSFLVAMTTFVMLFVGGARVAYLFGGILLAVPALMHVVTSSPYRLKRVLAFLDPWAHRQDIGYQVVQSLIALGSGRVTGQGLGAGNSKFFYLPAAHTDFILAGIGEELGFIGVCLVMCCFLCIAWTGLKISLAQSDAFAAYLAVGLTALILAQAILNVFVVLGLAPAKGTTLPFVSYGGSSLLATGFMAGLLIQMATSKAPLRGIPEPG